MFSLLSASYKLSMLSQEGVFRNEYLQNRCLCFMLASKEEAGSTSIIDYHHHFKKERQLHLKMQQRQAIVGDECISSA